jgi:Trk K+ transport system NAD-binding subunit
VLAVVILVLRPIGVWLSAWGSNLSRNERLFLSWVAPRGIVAASVSSLFAFELVDFGYEGARVLGPLVFLIIVGTVLIQGSTAKWLAQRLGVSDADPQGFLFMGASRLAQELALVLQRSDFVVRLIDSNSINVREARLRGLDAAQGDLLSDFVETNIDLSGIGRLLALTHNDEANTLACKHFEDEFGSSQVYQLPPDLANRRNPNPNLPQLGRLLFAQNATYQRLDRLLAEGAVIKRTQVTDQFTEDHFRNQYRNSEVIILMAMRGKQVAVSTVNTPVRPLPGWTLISLICDPAKPAVAPQAERSESLPLPA